MMEMIRSWRILPVSAWPRAMMDMVLGGFRAITSPQMRSFAVWAIAILFIGLLTGAMAVILPPMASIGVVALVGVVLLWAMPELRLVPDRLLRKMFFAMVFVQLCVPAYYAIDTGYLPWISVRRFFSLTVIMLFALTVAGSQSARDDITETVRRSRWLAVCAFGFLIMIFLSVLTARYPVASFKDLIDSILNWYVPFFACILIVRTKEDVVLLLKIIAIAAIVDSLAGLLEFFLQRRYYFDFIPASILESMLSSNPGLSAMYYTSSFRNGLYRASSIYSVPLSFGELAAMAAPIGAYFVFHGENMKWRLLGFATGIASIVTLLISGARGGFIALLVAVPIMMLLWTIRYSKENRASLVGVIMSAIFSIGFITVLGLITFSKRLSNIVLGGGDTVASTDARFTQWNMALPHVLRNPVSGNGGGTSGDVIGYLTPGGMPTVDSYLISLLVEVGVPGFVFFFGMIVVGIWKGASLYLRDHDPRAAVGGPIACALIAFGVYRFALSQRENHVLFFLIVGLVFAVSKLAYDRKTEKARAGALNPNRSHQRPYSPSSLPASLQS